MKKIVYSLCALMMLISASYAQETRFFIPKEVQQAYGNGTRAMNGAPGDAYWHNTVDYKIEAEVDPSDRSVTGSETITSATWSASQVGSAPLRCT